MDLDSTVRASGRLDSWKVFVQIIRGFARAASATGWTFSSCVFMRRRADFGSFDILTFATRSGPNGVFRVAGRGWSGSDKGT